MFQSSSGGASGPSHFSLPSFNQETVRHILLGDYSALIEAINRMAVLGYCVGEASPEGLRIAWSDPLPTGRNGGVHQRDDPQTHNPVVSWVGPQFCE